MRAAKHVESFLIRAYRRSAENRLFRTLLRAVRRLSQRQFMRSTVVTFFIIPEIQEVLCYMFPEAEGRIASLIKESREIRAMHLRFKEWQSGDYDVMLLYILTRLVQPSVVVETGIASGRSSTAILEGLAKNSTGTLYSVDLPSVYEGRRRQATHVDLDGRRRLIACVPDGEEPGWLVPQDLQTRWKRILGDTWHELPKLVDQLGTIDMFYHDSEHTDETMRMEFTSVWPKIPPGGLLVADDVMSTNAFTEFKKQHALSYTHTYNGLGVIRK